MELDVSQVLRLSTELDRSGGRLGRKAASAVRKSAQQVKTTAQSLAPVLTGALRASIDVTTTGGGRGAGITAEIGPSVPYAQYVEYGTAKMAPEPFMAPALAAVESPFVEAMQQAADQSVLP